MSALFQKLSVGPISIQHPQSCSVRKGEPQRLVVPLDVIL